MNYYDSYRKRACQWCAKGLRIHGYTSPSSHGALKHCKYCFYNDGKLVAHHHEGDEATLCAVLPFDQWAERLAEALSRIDGIATGEDQVAEDDTEGLAVIHKIVLETFAGAREALATSEGKAK